MSERDRKRLREIHTFPALVKYLREDLGWPVEQDSFDDLDDITFDWEADELGIDPDQAAKIEYIKQLRPLEHGEPQGVFFVKFDTKNLPVVALRRLLSKLVIKKRASAGASERPLWQMRNLVFISSYGESDERQLSFAYFQEPEHKGELPSLKVLGWDAGDTPLHLDRVHDQLEAHLAWPENAKELPQWRKQWSAAFELRHGEVVTTAKQLAEQLATLARGIRERANQLLRLETETGPLRTLMEGFKKALIHDLTEDQFADMYAQTIAYGLLSARITHPDRDKDPVKAETLPDLIPVTNPFLKELMETFVLAGGKHRGRKRGHHLDFDELGINDVVDLLRRANMDAVLRNFGADDRREDPVTYFYEDFLNAYDAQERKRRGVYYTPKPVVSYIVRSVHELLQTEFGIEDGLASTISWGEMAKRHKNLKIPQGVAPDSPFVQILDPATGTATFLVTVIEVIYDTLTEKWTKQNLSGAQRVAAWNEYVPTHLLPRLYGYELMMAPYAIAHLKIGLKLFETGYEFRSNKRARIYLTNALEPPTDAADSQIDALSEALAHEAQAVNAVKRSCYFTTIVGNPPYSNFGQLNKNDFITSLLDDYKRDLSERKLNLDDDFIKFVRLSQHLTAKAGSGLVGLITNNVYIDGLTHRQMRAALLSDFPYIRILDLHGSVTKAERAPDGGKDENVFEIQQGVGVTILSHAPQVRSSGVYHANLWGTRAEKYKELSTGTKSISQWASLVPAAPLYLFVPRSQDDTEEYSQFIGLREIFRQSSNGVKTERDAVAIQFSLLEIKKVVEDFRKLPEATIREKYQLAKDQRDWSIARAKADVIAHSAGQLFHQILYRPFDMRFTWYSGRSRGFIGTPGAAIMGHMLAGPNVALIATRQFAAHKYFSVFCTETLAEISSQPYAPYTLFPMYVYRATESNLLREAESEREANISRPFINALRKSTGFIEELIGSDSDKNGAVPSRALSYVYAVLHSPAYRARYSEALKADFPRVPGHVSKELFVELSEKGRLLLETHLLRSSMAVDVGPTYVGSVPVEVGSVSLKDGRVFLSRDCSSYFDGVGDDVWGFRIGSYQPCQKWLKDRKGRKLLKADIEHYQKIVVAISETIRIMKEIDEVIERHGGWPGAFKAGEAGKKGH